MQTFLPYPSFTESARVLDYRRLGKQRVEALQIHRALTGQSIGRGGWANHPATLMWRGYESALIQYKSVMIREWVERGYRNTMEIEPIYSCPTPPWLGNADFHASHRAALLAKDPEWYGQFNWTETPEINYIWPEAV